MSEVRFIVPGRVAGKGRPRFDPRSGRAYTDKKTKSAEEIVKFYAAAAMGSEKPFTGPLTVAIEIHYNTPKSWTKAARADAWHVTGSAFPDLDNVVKTVLDSCNGVVFEDDAQICTIFAGRRYKDKDEEHVDIRVFTPGTGWHL